MNAEPSPPNSAPVATPRRRWYQFTLRRLLVLITLLGLCFGWMVRAINQVRAVRHLAESGATFKYYRTGQNDCYEANSSAIVYTLRDGLDTAIAYRGAISSESQLQALISLKSLESVQVALDDGVHPNAAVRALSGLSKLRVLHLEMRTEDFEPWKPDFKAFANLEMLVISQERILPELIDQIGEMPKLRVLQLQGKFPFDTVAALERLPPRIELAVDAQWQTESRTIARLSELHSLLDLSLFLVELNGEDFAGSERNDRVKKLNLNSVRSNKMRFERFPNLEEVDVYDSELDDIALQDLLSLPRLKRLRLGCPLLPDHVAKSIDWSRYSQIELNLSFDCTEETLRLILSHCKPVSIDLTKTDLTYTAYRRTLKEFPHGSFRIPDKWIRLDAAAAAQAAQESLKGSSPPNGA